jgi:hypothetical protein
VSKLPTIFQTKWPSVLLGPISVSNYIVTVPSTYGLAVNQIVVLRLGTKAKEFEIKRVLSDTELQLGQTNSGLKTFLNPTEFDGGTLEMSEQERNKLGFEYVLRAVYQEEPAVALRSILVDWMGQHYSETNPLPVSGSLTVDIGNEVEIKNDSGNPVPVSGEVSISSLPEVEIKNDINNPIPSSIYTPDGNPNASTNPVWVTGEMNANITSGFSLDAFSRLRVSEPFTLGDYKHLYGIDPNFNDNLINGGTAVYNANKASATLSTSSDPSSRATHQTKMYHHYQPGKSQLILSSVVFGHAQQNVTKRTGYFDDKNGIFFEQVGSSISDNTDNGTLNWVIRSYTSGLADESDIGTYKRRVPQSEWNVDKCDGTGPSGFNIDTSKTQLIWTDFQWLGVGRVECGFVHDGKFVLAHRYYHSNILPEVYLSNPNLPVRCEILNTGATTGGSMDQICSTVATEGGYIESGIDFSVYSPIRATIGNGQTTFPLMAVRLKNSFNGYDNRVSARANQTSFYVENNSIVYEIIKLPSAASLSTTLNGGVLTWVSADASSAVEYCVNATDFVSVDADRLSSGFVPSGASQNSLSPVASGSISSAKKNVISQNFDSTSSEVYVIVVSTVLAGNNLSANVACAFQWREIY